MSDEFDDETKAVLIRIITQEKRRAAAVAKAIADQPALPDRVSAELCRELTTIKVGTDQTRAMFAQKADHAWRQFNFNLQDYNENRQKDEEIELRRTQIVDRICSLYRELIDLQGEFINLFNKQYPDDEMRPSYFIEVLEPIIEGIELERTGISDYLADWRFINLSSPTPKRVGRPGKGGPELGFAADLAAAWQQSFDLPAGVGSESRFMRIYSPLCGQLGLRPIGGPKLARLFKWRSKLFGERLGAEQRGRPKNNPKNQAKPF